MQVTEKQLKSILNEAVKNVLTEAKMDPFEKVNDLIAQANEAYRKAEEHMGGDEWPLMNFEGTPYGLSGDIRLDGRGYIIIPFRGSMSGLQPERIRVIQKVGGKYKLIKDDYWTEGWNTASKYLKDIIKDAQRGIAYFQEYDPNWEDAESQDEYNEKVAAMKDMNKKIGLKANTGVSNIDKNWKLG